MGLLLKYGPEHWYLPCDGTFEYSGSTTMFKDRIHFLTPSSAENEIRNLESARSHRKTTFRGVSEGSGLVENDSDRFLTDSRPVLDEFRLGDR